MGSQQTSSQVDGAAATRPPLLRSSVMPMSSCWSSAFGFSARRRGGLFRLLLARYHPGAAAVGLGLVIRLGGSRCPPWRGRAQPHAAGTALAVVRLGRRIYRGRPEPGRHDAGPWRLFQQLLRRRHAGDVLCRPVDALAPGRDAAVLRHRAWGATSCANVVLFGLSQQALAPMLFLSGTAFFTVWPPKPAGACAEPTWSCGCSWKP